MSHNIAIILAVVASIVTTCTSLPDYHKQMSPTQLRSVFHVDSVNAVPHYEVVQLLHHSFDDGVATASLPEHYRRRRRRSINSVAPDADARLTLKEPHHVKKDLSKNPYYSELKAAANAPGAGGVNSLGQAAARGKFAGDLRELKTHNVSFKAFGENLNLALKQTDSLFKGESPHKLRMWTVSEEANATQGLDMQEVFDEDAQSSDQIGQVYQDESNMAAILMRRHLETGDLIMEGSIGHEMVIKPLPHELSPNPDAAHHIVYKRDAQHLEHLSDFAFMEPDDLATSEKLERLQQRRQRRSAPLDDDEAALEELDDELDTLQAEASNTRNKRQVPYVIYPEVLVIIDYDGYRLHGGDNLQVKRYFVSFWNGVDLRYRLLKGPRIRISIAGIIISRGRDATPYLERNRVGRDAIDSAAALTDMGKYLFRERRLPVYDIAVAITKYDMCRRRKGGRCTKGTAGFAYVGGACVVNKRLEKVNSVAIIEDTGGFSGIIVAAHEVGHLLGAVHDGSPPPSYLGGPGAQRCRWEDGYIMSDLRHTERGFRWSPCTIQSFHHFLNGDTATCLHNAPHEDSALGRALPGTLLSLDAQCRRDRGTYACFKDERVCAQLFCFDAQTGYCVAYRPAAEGSTCGTGLQCLDGRCTPLASNVIPAYRSYNDNSASSSNTENIENSSVVVEDESVNGGDTINAAKQQTVLDNRSHKRRLDSTEDSTVEVTSSEIDDTADPNRITTKTVTTKNTHTPTQTNSLTTINLETHSRHHHNKQNNNNQRQVQQGTFEFLARFLAQNPQWQQLLGQALQAQVQAQAQANAIALAGAPATNDADVASQQSVGAAVAVAQNVTPQQQQQQTPQALQKLPHGTVVVKTSVSSSTSSSSGGGSKRASSSNSSDRRHNANSSEEKVKPREKGDAKVVSDKNFYIKYNEASTEDVERSEIIEQNESNYKMQEESEIKAKQSEIDIETVTPAHIPQQQATVRLTQYNTLSQLTQIQQQQIQTQPATAPTTATPPQPPNLFQFYTHELRKQLQYYLGLLRANASFSDSVTSSSSSSSIKSSSNSSTATAKISATTTTNNSNYSNTVSAAAKLQQHATLHNNNNGDDEDDHDNEDNIDDTNVDDDDDASNEAIDDKQQKRKFNTATTISVHAQPEHTQRLQQLPPPSSAPMRNSGGNGNSNSNTKALQRPATFIDAYLKKLQALNAPADATASLTATTTSTTMSTSSVSGAKVVAKGMPAERATAKPAGGQAETTFGSHFLKRTLNANGRGSVGGSSGVGSVGSGSGSNSNDNHGISSSNMNNNKNRNHKKLTRIASHTAAATYKQKQNDYDNENESENENENANENEQEQHVVRGQLHIATTTQQPAYVTNYLGDNTNHLPRLLEQQQALQQQEQQSSSTKTTTTTTTTTSSQPNQQSSQQKAHKVKTQKLIRRQLLRTQIK